MASSSGSSYELQLRFTSAVGVKKTLTLKLNTEDSLHKRREIMKQIDEVADEIGWCIEEHNRQRDLRDAAITK
jgi:hypothetical protein